MIITTTDQIEGKRVVETFGLVRGSTIRARNVGRDIMASLRSLVGGEIPEYTKLLGQSREQSMQRMTEEAEQMGANAIIGARFSTSMIMSGTSEIMVYGTAVKIE